jgi:hypothetical protein
MNVSTTKARRLLKALGYEDADSYDIEKLTTFLNDLPARAESRKPLKAGTKEWNTFDSILKALPGGEEIQVKEYGGPAKVLMGSSKSAGEVYAKALREREGRAGLPGTHTDNQKPLCLPRSAAELLFKEMGFENADAWDDEKLTDRVKDVSNILEKGTGKEPESKEARKTLKEIQAALKEGRAVVLAPGSGKLPEDVEEAHRQRLTEEAGKAPRTITFRGRTFTILFPDLLPPLTDKEFQRLKKSIEEKRGVLVAVVIDEHDGVIDGQNRLQIAHDLYLPEEAVPFDPRPGLTLEQKRELALDLNEHRRHLTLAQQKELREKRILLVAKMAQEGKSTRDIAKETNVSQTQVQQDLKKATEQGCSVDPKGGKIKGKDNREYAAEKVKGKGKKKSEKSDAAQRAQERIRQEEGSAGLKTLFRPGEHRIPAQEVPERLKSEEDPVPQDGTTPAAGEDNGFVLPPDHSKHLAAIRELGHYVYNHFTSRDDFLKDPDLDLKFLAGLEGNDWLDVQLALENLAILSRRLEDCFNTRERRRHRREQKAAKGGNN